MGTRAPRIRSRRTVARLATTATMDVIRAHRVYQKCIASLASSCLVCFSAAASPQLQRPDASSSRRASIFHQTKPVSVGQIGRSLAIQAGRPLARPWDVTWS